MQIVIVPGWQRAGFLEACLRRLSACDRPDLVVWVALDRGYDQASMDVAQRWSSMWPNRYEILVDSHPYAGNSHNLLCAYKRALGYSPTPDLIHLVEEDVFIANGYFEFHDQAHTLVPDAFAVSGCQAQMFLQCGPSPDPNPGLVSLAPRYQSLGVSFRPNRLEAIRKHLVTGYFTNPIGYCRVAFPYSKLPKANAEQDGLFDRLVEASGTGVVYPWTPRAYHSGFIGYHRNGLQLPGDPSTQADRLLAMTADELNAAAYSYPDHVTVDLNVVAGPVTEVVAWPTR
jgi:hypothetical protein